jgi:hypothetical protein
MIESALHRHARACRGHPRVFCGNFADGEDPAMTAGKWLNVIGNRSSISASSTEQAFIARNKMRKAANREALRSDLY